MTTTPTDPLQSGNLDPNTVSQNIIASTPPQQRGIFGQLGQFLHDNAGNIQQIGAQLAQAGGNSAPMQSLLARRQQDLEAQQLGSQQATADLQRQLLQKHIENYQTPEQQEALAVKQAGDVAEAQRTYSPPTDIVAPMDNGQLGHYQRAYNPNTQQYETTPTMVAKPVPNPTVAPTMPPVPPIGNQGPMPPASPIQPNAAGMTPSAIGNVLTPSPAVQQQTQLAAMPKPNGAPVVEPTRIGSSTGYDHVWYVNGQETGRAPGALPNPAFVPTTTSASGVNTTLKQDVNGNWVAVQEPHTNTSTKAPTFPGITPSTAGPSGPGNGTGSANGQTPPPSKPKSPLARPGGPVATPVTDAQGNPIHAPFSAPAKKNINSIDNATSMINDVVPGLDTQVKQAGGGANGLWDMGKQRAAWLEYQAGKEPTNIDPNLAKILPLVAQLQIVAGLPYMQGTRSYRYMQQIQQHLPNPEKDTPQLMLSKLHSLQTVLPQFRQNAIQDELNPIGNNPLANPNSTPKPSGNRPPLSQFGL